MNKLTGKNNLIELKLDSKFSQIKLLKLEKINGIFTRETFQFSFTKTKESLVIDVENSENEIVLIILEIDTKESDLIFDSENNGSNKEDLEMKQQLDTLKNLFGGETELSLTDSTVEETNNVFDNFGKGFSSLFSMAPQLQVQPHLELNKNENSKMTWNFKKKT
jgi:hypothetical protein